MRIGSIVRDKAETTFSVLVKGKLMKLLRFLFGLFLMANLPVIVESRAVVIPSESNVSAWERYLLRVPNDRGVAAISVELTFPSGLKVMSFQDVPGWKLTVHKDTAGVPIAAEWNGNLGVGRFVDFPFVAVNPDTSAVLTWPTTQEYLGGELVHWTGADTSAAPVSSTRVNAPAPIVQDTAKVTQIVEEEDEEGFLEEYSDFAAWAALPIALVALMLTFTGRRKKAE
ncbi:MAG TPA: DUF1775 domain-containing protein [candidate division Zixibacteria bacterium]|nr:DUF1775 domain-containing protein [candidate division Zixibacteria bacterium]